MKKSIMLVSVFVAMASAVSAEEAGCAQKDRPIVVTSDTGATSTLQTNTASGWCQTVDESIDNPVWKPNGESAGEGTGASD